MSSGGIHPASHFLNVHNEKWTENLHKTHHSDERRTLICSLSFCLILMASSGEPVIISEITYGYGSVTLLTITDPASRNSF